MTENKKIIPLKGATWSRIIFLFFAKNCTFPVNQSHEKFGRNVVM